MTFALVSFTFFVRAAGGDGADGNKRRRDEYEDEDDGTDTRRLFATLMANAAELDIARSDLRLLMKETKLKLRKYDVELRQYGNSIGRGSISKTSTKCDVEAVRRAMQDIPKIWRPIPCINHGTSSYGMKHRLERWRRDNGVPISGRYVSNGDFTMAMQALGYVSCWKTSDARPDSWIDPALNEATDVNACFNAEEIGRPFREFIEEEGPEPFNYPHVQACETFSDGDTAHVCCFCGELTTHCGMRYDCLQGEFMIRNPVTGRYESVLGVVYACDECVKKENAGDRNSLLIGGHLFVNYGSSRMND